MPPRLKKLIGTILLVTFVIVYALLAMVAGNMVVASKSGPVQFVFFVLAGLAWVPPAGAIIWWMQRPAPRSGRG